MKMNIIRIENRLIASVFRARPVFKNAGAFLLLSFLSIACSKTPVSEYEFYPKGGAPVSGVVNGLEGKSLKVSLNGSFEQTITENGLFELNETVQSGQRYVISVAEQPQYPAQSCSISGAEGTALLSIADIKIECVTDKFTITGNVSGLNGSGLQLRLNGAETVAVNADGSFTFETAIEDNGAYNVQVAAHPSSPNQICTPSANTGQVTSSDVTDVQVLCSTVLYPVGGFINNLAGGSVTLQLNGGDDRTLSTNGFFLFNTPVADTSPFTITVKTQPSSPAQTCSVTGGAGLISGKGVYNSIINCATTAYSVGGTVTGLDNNAVSLVSSSGEILQLTDNGSYSFSNSFADTSGYAVEIFRDPVEPVQNCTVSNAAGSISAADVGNVNVSCQTEGFNIGGSVTGLTDTGLVLELNGTYSLAVANGSTTFQFSEKITDTENYSVTVPGQPNGQYCSVTNGSGTVSSADVSNIAISCAPAYTIGGSISGLNGSNLVLQNNGGDSTVINANGTYTMLESRPTGASYSITVANHPENPYQNCSVANATGTVGTANITGINISCSNVILEFTSTTGSANEAGATINVPISITPASSRDISVGLGIAGGSASGSVDYTLASSTVNIPAGNTTADAQLTIIDDSIYELNETVQLAITGADKATLGTQLNYTHTITNVDPVTATRIVTTSAPSDFTAGFSTSMTVKLYDEAGYLASTDSSTQVTFNLTGSAVVSGVTTGTGDGTVNSNNETVTVDNGVATVEISNPVAETFTIAVTNTNSLTNPADESVTTEDAASRVELVTAASDFTAGGSTNLEVAIQSSAGTLISADNSTEITFTPTGNGAITGVNTGTSVSGSGAAGAARAVRVSNGRANITVENTTAETFTIAITDDAGLTDPTDESIIVTHAAPNKVVITSAGADFTAGGNTSLSVQVQDQYNNPATNDSSTSISFMPSNSGTISGVTTGSGDGIYGTVGGAEVVTVAGGVAAITLTNTVAETFTVTISSSLNDPAADSITVSPAASNKVVITSAATDFAAGGSTSLSVQVQDQYNNPATGDSSTSISFTPSNSGTISAVTTGSGDGGYGVVGGAESVTVASGDAIITLTNTVAETFTVTISSSLNDPAADSITVSPAPADKVVITSAGADFTAGGNTSLSVQVQDQYNNPATNDSSTSISFMPSNSGTISGVTTGSGDGSYGTVGGAEVVTVAGGVAAITLTNTVAETFTVTISSSLNDPAADSITVSPAPADKVVITSAAADFYTHESTSIGVQVQDQYNNPLTGDSGTQVTFSVSGSAIISSVNTGTGDGSVNSNNEAVTVSSGNAEVVITDTIAETITISISSSLIDPSDTSVIASSATGAEVTAAEYHDTDHNGKIDHVKITFDKNVDETTLTSYNAGGTDVSTRFLISGYSGITMRHNQCIDESNPPNGNCTDAGELTDTTGNNIVWLSFTEGANYDTGSKPDLTGVDVSLQTDISQGGCFIYTSGGDCNTQTQADFGTAAVTEADRAPAVLLSAWSDPIVDAWQVRLQFSEAVDTTSGGGCSGSVANSAFTYNDTSGGDASALRTDSADSNGCDIETDGTYLIKPRVNARLTHADLGTDTITPQATLYDAADQPALQSAKTINYDPALEVYYPMDGSLGDNGTTIQDVTANNRDGAVSGAALSSDMGEIANQAYSFDGVDDSITVTGYKGVLGTNARTISIWYQPTKVDSILMTYGTDSPGNLWRLLSGNAFGNSGIEVNNGHRRVGYPTISQTWHHIAVTYDPVDGNNILNAKVYHDGRTPTSVNSKLQVLNTLSGIDVTFGTGNFFRGKIDEARIYSRALSASEVKKLATKVPGGLVTHYQLDNDAIDDAGNGLDGTLVGSPGTANDRYGKANRSYTFDGSTQYITVADNSLLKPTNTITVSAWAYHADWSTCTSGDPSILSKGESGNAGYYFECDSATGELAFIMSRNGTKIKIGTAPADLNGGAWHHLTGTYDGQLMKFYVDGVLTNSNDAGSAYTIDHSNDIFYIARDWENEEYPGSIDDVRVYNRALTAGEVKALATEFDRGLVAYYPLDDNTTSTAAGAIKDYSGSNYHLTLSSGPTPTSDRFGGAENRAYFFNGSGNLARTDTLSNLPGGDSDRTMCLWVTVQSANKWAIDYGNATPSAHNQYRIRTGNTFNFSTNFHTGGAPWSPLAASLNQWTHVCGRFGSGANELFLNGTLEAGTTGYGSGATGQARLVIGAQTSGGDVWQGKVDDVRIYNRALSLEEIRELSGFHPGQLDDISLHLDAGRAVFNDAGTTLATNTQTVQEWHDISFTNGTANGINVSQGTASDRPTWRETVATINNMPVVRFDGNNDRLSRTVLGTDILTADAYSIFAVMMQDGTQAENGLIQWGFNGNDRMTLVPTQNDTIRFMGSRLHDPSGMTDVAQPAGWDDNYHTIYAWLSGSSGEINVDGTTIDSFSNMWYDMTNTSSSLGLNVGSENNGQWLKGDIAEIMMFKRAPSQKERDKIVCYFHKKYGITVSISCD